MLSIGPNQISAGLARLFTRHSDHFSRSALLKDALPETQRICHDEDFQLPLYNL
jgi:hypothetical protein